MRHPVVQFSYKKNGAVSRGAGLHTQVGQPSYGESTPNVSISDDSIEYNYNKKVEGARSLATPSTIVSKP